MTDGTSLFMAVLPLSEASTRSVWFMRLGVKNFETKLRAGSSPSGFRQVTKKDAFARILKQFFSI